MQKKLKHKDHPRCNDTFSKLIFLYHVKSFWYHSTYNHNFDNISLCNEKLVKYLMDFLISYFLAIKSGLTKKIGRPNEIKL